MSLKNVAGRICAVITLKQTKNTTNKDAVQNCVQRFRDPLESFSRVEYVSRQYLEFIYVYRLY